MKVKVLPKEEKFFTLFGQQAKYIAEAAQLLLTAVNAPGNMGVQMAQVRDLEHKCDEVTHDIIIRLNQTFITPFDPEDIHRLASCLDDVMDMIDAALGRLTLFKMTDLPPAVISLAEIIEACSRAIVKALNAMADDTPVTDYIIEINQLENDADRVNRQALAELFEKETNAIELIKRKEIYEIMESATDLCEDVANVIESVVVKNT